MDKETPESCPNCGSELNRSILSQNLLLGELKTRFINVFAKKNKDGYCGICALKALPDANRNYKYMSERVFGAYKNYLSSIPILTIENPDKWEYEILGVVTARTFIVGNEESMKKGEDQCFFKIREAANSLNGNAIIGVSIVYGLQVMTVYGTAINVLNEDVFSEEYKIAKRKYKDLKESRDLLEEFKKIRK